jgi:magnesium transporter
VRLNEVMKALTIVSTIFLPLSFVAGVYGMNFHFMPELSWKWGYPLVWVVFLLIAGGMLYYFRKRNWF